MQQHRCRSERRAYEGRSGYCGLLFTRAGSVRDITFVGSQRPASNPSTSRATNQSASKPPPPPREAMAFRIGRESGNEDKAQGWVSHQGKG